MVMANKIKPARRQEIPAVTLKAEALL